jgi:hypothetical protein
LAELADGVVAPAVEPMVALALLALLAGATFNRPERRSATTN